MTAPYKNLYYYFQKDKHRPMLNLFSASLISVKEHKKNGFSQSSLSLDSPRMRRVVYMQECWVK